MLRRGGRQRDFIGLAAPDAILAFLQSEKTGDAQPAIVLFERRFAMRAVLLHIADIAGIRGERQQAGGQKKLNIQANSHFASRFLKVYRGSGGPADNIMSVSGAPTAAFA